MAHERNLALEVWVTWAEQAVEPVELSSHRVQNDLAVRGAAIEEQVQ